MDDPERPLDPKEKYLSLLRMSALVVALGLLLTYLPRVLPKAKGPAPSPPIATSAPVVNLPLYLRPTPTLRPITLSLSGRLDATGALAQDVQAVSDDGLAVLELPKGTKVLDAQGQTLDSITVTTRKLPLRWDIGLVGLAYEFGPQGTILTPPAQLAISFDPGAFYPFQYLSQMQALPFIPFSWQDIGRVYMAYWGAQGLLSRIASVDSTTASIAASIDRLGTIVLYVY